MVKHQKVSEYYENDCSYKRCFECKAAEIESIITDITNLATNATLNTKTKRIENKIRDTASFVKKEKNKFETFVLSYSRAKVVLMMMGCKII